MAKKPVEHDETEALRASNDALEQSIEADRISFDQSSAETAAVLDAARITEAKRISIDLIRQALRLNELGCVVAGGRVLDAAVRVSKLKPGRFA